MDGDTMTPGEPRWLTVARYYDGLTEVPGDASNPMILSMARAIGAPAWFHNDDQPWCAVFQNFALLESDVPMAIGLRGDVFDRLRALTFRNDTRWGIGLAGPALGAIAVFSRPDGAHVGMYLGEHGDRLRIFGGNQSNRVCATWMRRDRLRGYYWPRAVPVPALGAIALADDGGPTSGTEA
jgi:uncharacterized protein (TIGR02594 family)